MHTDSNTDMTQSRQIKSLDIKIMGRRKILQRQCTDDKPALQRTLKAHFR